MEEEPGPPSRTYQRLILLAVVLCGLGLVMMGGKGLGSSRGDYQPALWSCSVVGR